MQSDHKHHTIVADVRMEECYAALALSFDRNDEALRSKIDNVLNDVCKTMRLEPISLVCRCDASGETETFYIEFDDQAQRDAGACFGEVMRRLGIERCIDVAVKPCKES